MILLIFSNPRGVKVCELLKGDRTQKPEKGNMTQKPEKGNRTQKPEKGEQDPET